MDALNLSYAPVISAPKLYTSVLAAIL